jgi:hypothetical protein
MSSFIAEEKTIPRMITHIDRHKGNIGFGFVGRKLQEMGYAVSARSGLDRLGTDLFALEGTIPES